MQRSCNALIFYRQEFCRVGHFLATDAPPGEHFLGTAGPTDDAAVTHTVGPYRAWLSDVPAAWKIGKCHLFGMLAA